LEECLKYGEIENLLVVQNMGDHMIGNVFVRYLTEEMAEKAVNGVRGRFYAGRKVHAMFSPVHDFAYSRCNDFQDRRCTRGQFCNFAHYMATPRWANKHFTYPNAYSYKRVKKRGRSDAREPSFPIRGTSEERRRIIAQWNKVREEKGILKTFDNKILGNTSPNGSQTGGLNLFKPH